MPVSDLWGIALNPIDDQRYVAVFSLGTAILSDAPPRARLLHKEWWLGILQFPPGTVHLYSGEKSGHLRVFCEIQTWKIYIKQLAWCLASDICSLNVVGHCHSYDCVILMILLLLQIISKPRGLKIPFQHTPYSFSSFSAPSIVFGVLFSYI